MSERGAKPSGGREEGDATERVDAFVAKRSPATSASMSGGHIESCLLILHVSRAGKSHPQPREITQEGFPSDSLQQTCQIHRKSRTDDRTSDCRHE